MLQSKFVAFSIAMLVLIGSGPTGAAILFEEDFESDGIVDAGNLSTTNTAFDGTHEDGGTADFKAPGSFDGNSGLLGNTGNVYASGDGKFALAYEQGFTPGKVFTLSFDLKAPSNLQQGADVMAITLGNSSVSSTNSFLNSSNSTAMFVLHGFDSSNQAKIQSRTYNDVTEDFGWVDSEKKISSGESLNLRFVINGSDSEVAGVDAGTADIYVNGERVDENIEIVNRVSATGFRFAVGNLDSGEAFEIDNVLLQNTAVVPEPSSAMLLLGSSRILATMRRR